MFTIAQFGTFEVENYGDRLFPIILEKALASRIDSFQIQLYSPLGDVATNRIFPIKASKGESLFYSEIAPQACVVGGGDLITFATNVSVTYRSHWHSQIGPLASCWAISGLRRPSGIPLIWNACGVPSPFTSEQAAFVAAIASEVDYLTVRDEQSCVHLCQAGVEREIAVVPDTAVILPEHFPADSLRKRADEIFRSFGFALGEPLIFQVNSSLDEGQLMDFVIALKQIKKMLGRPLLLLPIGHCHEDDIVLAKFKKASNDEFALITEKLDTISTAAVIAHSSGFIGSSLHGNVTAFAYGIPHLIYQCAPLSKLEGFLRHTQEEERLVLNLEQLLQRALLLRVQPSRSVYRELVKRVEKHFDRLVESMLRPSPYRIEAQNVKLLEEYLHLLFDMQHMRYEMQQMQSFMKTGSWRLATAMQKYGRQLPFLKSCGKRLLTLYSKDA